MRVSDFHISPRQTYDDDDESQILVDFFKDQTDDEATNRIIESQRKEIKIENTPNKKSHTNYLNQKS